MEIANPTSGVATRVLFKIDLIVWKYKSINPWIIGENSLK